MNIGGLLKEIRTGKGLTLSEVADAVSLTSSSLSQIENDKIHPSIQTLESILHHYRIPMSEFFRQMERADFIFLPHSSLETVQLSDGVSISLFASKLRDNSIESYDVVLQPGAHIAVKQLSSFINGERFVIVREGTVSAEMMKERITLQEGDSLNFKSGISCTIHNLSAKEVRLFINGMPPVL